VTAQLLPDGLVTELAAGHVPWDLLRAFPRQDPGEQAAGDDAVGNLERVLTSCLEGQRVEEERELPPGFFETVHRAGLLRIQVDPADGGLGLSDFNTFRVITAAMERSTAAGFALAVHNGIGLPALLPADPSGVLRELILERLAQGAVSGWADTEPHGAANILPVTVAEPRPGGGYRLTGEKAFIGNGTIADELIVSAIVPGAEGSSGPDARLFLVDTSCEGFRVRSAQEVIGLKGLSLGALELAGVEVPAARVITGPGLHWRDGRLLEPISSRGRTYLVSGAALAIARRCVEFQRDFARRRTVDGRGLGDYPAIKRLLARSLADLYAIDTVVRWGLLGDGALSSRHRDRYAAKNITTRACWRIVDRTVSLLAAEGAETVASKQRRGVPPLPVEQLFRDARVLRVTGGVDFAVDLRSGQALLAHLDSDGPDVADHEPAAADGRLTRANARHLETVAAQSRRLAHALGGMARRSQDRGGSLNSQISSIAVGRIAGELLSMALTLARCADSPARSAAREQQLAGIHCSDACGRLTSVWQDIESRGHDADHSSVSDWWLGTPPPTQGSP
jgi:alkylation response protein AidB-like acyl-CoA dehydrogenase